MTETIRTLPKFSPIRTSVAEQVRFARQLDRSGDYITTRKLSNYIDSFAGLTELFNHIKTINPQGTVLDIGAGKAFAISELNMSEIGNGLDYLATVLTRPQKTSIPAGKIISTTAENLFGIPNESITGILSCYGLAYSVAPERVIRRIDEVLVDGAPLKATFYGKILSPSLQEDYHGLQDSSRFLWELKRLNYDIATQKHMAGEIVLAIKPGGKCTISASDLLAQDEKIYWDSFQKEK
jgi:hypothetical protein